MKMLGRATLWWSVIFLISFPLLQAEDSLQSALNAVNRRQRDLSDYRKYADFENDGLSKFNENDNLEFLPPDNFGDNDDFSNKNLEKVLLQYLDEKDIDRGDASHHISSPFRERVEKDKARQREKVAGLLLNKLYNEDNENDYVEKYPKPYADNYEEEPVIYSNKRSYYNKLGWDSVGMRKRSRYFQPDGRSEPLYLLNYIPREEIFNRLEEEEGDANSEYSWNKFPRERKSPRLAPLNLKKRFPVAKRSSSYYPLPVQSHFTLQNKAISKTESKKTDPKVQKELSNIFNPKSNVKPSKTKKVIIPTDKPKKPVGTKEVVPANIPTTKPIEVQKKSIDWSDYFGLDRRKKSDEELDSTWLMEKYHKAIDVSKRKHPEAEKENSTTHNSKMSKMDAKLENIEEKIMDDALKFTGSHQGALDHNEIQDVKDALISRLAAAYKLEIIRRAIKEHNKSLDNQRSLEYDFLNAKKRVSVPRKEAVDAHRDRMIEEDNNIKCAQGDEDCDDPSYKIPNELLEQINWGECPKIERACNEIASLLGPFERVFEKACQMHQMCLLCRDNSWFSPTQQCDELFLFKADELCDGDSECRSVAQQSVKYLLQVDRSLKADSFSVCDLECPELR